MKISTHWILATIYTEFAICAYLTNHFELGKLNHEFIGRAVLINDPEIIFDLDIKVWNLMTAKTSIQYANLNFEERKQKL